jgi:hypothetical protein
MQSQGPEHRWKDEWPFKKSRRERFVTWLLEGLSIVIAVGVIGAVVGLALAPWYGWDTVALGAAVGALLVVSLWLSAPS